MNLNLQDVILLSDAEIQAIRDRYDTFQQTKMHIEAQGFPEPIAPAFPYPERDYVEEDATPHDLSVLMMQMEAWFSAAQGCLSYLRAEKKTVRGYLDDIELALKKQIRKSGNKVTKEDVEYYVGINPHHTEIRARLIHIEAQMEIMQGHADIADRKYKTLSRQLEALKMSFETSRMGANLPRRGTPRVNDSDR